MTTIRDLTRSMKPEQIYATSRPRVGDPITYRGEVTGAVKRVEGALCWNQEHGKEDALPFIWCFRDGLNTMHDWPTKR